MKLEHSNLEVAADSRANCKAYGFVVFFTLLSWMLLSNTEQLESAKAGRDVMWVEPWLTQGTSHLAMLVTILMIPHMLSRWPITLENWKRKAPIYICGFFIFGAIHITLMHIFRAVSFPLFLDRPNTENLLDLNIWVYELRKDAYTYLLLLSVFLTSRQMEQLRMESAQIRAEAKASGRIILKSGGRTIYLQADEIVWAESASNYVEIHTQTGRHLVRMTLGALESLLREAGPAHTRIHRSYLVKREAVQEVIPVGDGRALAKLKDGQELVMSRKYRDQFAEN